MRCSQVPSAEFPSKPSGLGLYEIDGDTLKLCFFDLPPRPRALAGKEEVLRKMVLIFKRARKSNE
jgi:hypothetical protein